LEPTLIVVDDRLRARQTLAKLASSLDVRCKGFASVKEFLAVYEPAQPGCLVARLHLPEMGRLEPQAYLAAAGNTLPVIFVSVRMDVPGEAQAMGDGAFAVIQEPYRAHELAHLILQAFCADRELREREARLTDLCQRINTLTTRERRVMELILTDTPNRVIALNLKVSRRTVDRIRAAIYQKLGVMSAIGMAQRVAAMQAPEARHPLAFHTDDKPVEGPHWGLRSACAAS